MGLLKGMHQLQWQPTLSAMQCKYDRLAADVRRCGDCRRCCSSLEPHADLMEHAGRIKFARSVAQELQGRRDWHIVTPKLIRWQAEQAKGTNAASQCK